MSRENVEKVVRRFFEAWNARDADALAENTHAQGEIILPRNLLEGGSYTGPEGARRALADALETWEETTVTVEGRTWQALTFRGGKILSFRAYETEAEALEAVGLSE